MVDWLYFVYVTRSSMDAVQWLHVEERRAITLNWDSIGYME